MSCIVAIVGRPNVGKSTLFNRLTKTRHAIVDATSGVTRDRHYGKSDWNGIPFSVIDTGGYIEGSEDIFEKEIQRQVLLAIDEADIILFITDVDEGLTPMDEDVADMLRKTPKKVFLVANKVDNPGRLTDIHEFYKLGLGEVYGISSINGSGTGELLDDIIDFVKSKNIHTDINEEELPRFAVVGRPNVGKSSMINALTGKDSNIVTPVPGTTRDSIFTKYNAFEFEFYLVDTAGLRKKSKVYENIEFYSTLRSVRAIENADVCILMIDASQGLESQDLNILRLIEKNHKGVVIVVNKWDLIEKEANTHLSFRKHILNKTAPFTDIPVVFTSVLNKQRIYKTLEEAFKIYKNKNKKIPTSKLNEVLLPVIQKYQPPMSRGKNVSIKYITQLKTHYPTFVFFSNTPQAIKEPYKRYLENNIRRNFDFQGIPIEIYFRKK